MTEHTPRYKQNPKGGWLPTCRVPRGYSLDDEHTGVGDIVRCALDKLNDGATLHPCTVHRHPKGDRHHNGKHESRVQGVYTRNKSMPCEGPSNAAPPAWFPTAVTCVEDTLEPTTPPPPVMCWCMPPPLRPGGRERHAQTRKKNGLKSNRYTCKELLPCSLPPYLPNTNHTHMAIRTATCTVRERSPTPSQTHTTTTTTTTTTQTTHTHTDTRKHAPQQRAQRRGHWSPGRDRKPSLCHTPHTSGVVVHVHELRGRTGLGDSAHALGLNELKCPAAIVA